MLGTAKAPIREATIHQSPSGDLAIRQGPWKMIFLKDGNRELYNLQTDLGESKNALVENPEVVRLRGFLDSIRKGENTNEISVGVDSTLTGILARTAAYRGEVYSWDKMLEENEKLNAGRLD